FESYPSAANRLAVEGSEHRLYWDVRDQDVAIFAALLTRAIPLVREWIARDGLRGEVLIDAQAPETLREVLAAPPTDASHLGRGLAVGRNLDRGVVGPDLRFHGIGNV